jgi:hypothetical protein
MADPVLTYPTTQTFGGMIVALGNGATPTEVFAAPCGFDTKALNLTATASEANIPPCNSPDTPGWTARGVSAFSAEVTGSGVMATEDGAMWSEWLLSGLPKNVQVTLSATEIYQGPAVLTALGASAALASNGKLVQRSVTISSAGPWTNTAATGS